ncbi:MAG: tetratricopeptide repeat protein [Bacteroidota bacterium]
MNRIIRLYGTFFLLACHALLSAQDGDTTILEAQLLHANHSDSIDLMQTWAWDNRKQNSRVAATYTEAARDLTTDSLQYHQLTRQLASILRYKGDFFAALDTFEASLIYFTQQKNELEIALTQFELSALHAAMGNFSTSDSLLRLSKPLLIENAASNAFVRSYLIEATNLFYQNKYDLARERYEEVLRICDMPNHVASKAIVLRSFGFFEKQMGNYDASLRHFFEAMELGLEDYHQNTALIHVSGIYQILEDWDRALQYELEGLAVSKKLNQPIGVALHLKELGHIHLSQEKTAEALQYFYRSLAIAQTTDTQYMILGDLLKNIGEIHKKQGQTASATSNFEQAITYFDRAIEDFENNTTAENTHSRDANKVRCLKALVLFELDQLEEARIVAEKCLEIAATENDQYVSLYMNELLAKIYIAKGEPQKANAYEAAYLQIEKDLVDLDEMRSIAAIEISQKEQSTNMTSTKVQLSSAWWIALLIVLALILFGVIWYQKNSGQQVGESATVTEVAATTSNTNPPGSNIKNMSTFLLETIEQEKDWASFTTYFQHIHPDFFKQLKVQYPTITSNELNLSALLKLNIQNKEIAQLLGISPDSVRKAQHRLSKKIDLAADQSVRDYMILF